MSKTEGYQAIEVKPISGALGAEISGVDLREVDDLAFSEIYRAWLEHLVIFFRDQHLSPEQQIAFARRFGTLQDHPYLHGLPGHPEIIEIVRTETDQFTFGSNWHTDQMFEVQPPKATLLYARETPDVGGDTLFSNQYLAYETLSEGMKAMLSAVRTWNVGDRKGAGGTSRRAARTAGAEEMAGRAKEAVDRCTENAHPLVRIHPETERKVLYIGGHTINLAGFAKKEARPLMKYLREHSTDPMFTCRFRWSPGSMAIWDNRCTQHRALGDTFGKRRRMHRITVAGEAPFGVEGSPRNSAFADGLSAARVDSPPRLPEGSGRGP